MLIGAKFQALGLVVILTILISKSTLSSAQLPGLKSLFSQFGLSDTQSNQVKTDGSQQQLQFQSLPSQQKPGFDRKCLMCKFSVSLINYALKTKRGYDQVDKIANNFCISAHLEAPLVCSKISKLFNHEVTKVLSYGMVTPDQICGLLSNNTCGHFHSPLDDWEIQLQASEHLNRTRLDEELKLKTDSKRSVLFNETSTDTFRVIHISDTHIDLNYAYNSPAKCEEPLCCQVTSTPKNGTTEEKAGYWGHYGFCDIPLRTFVATLKHLNETLSKSTDIKYIIWTGDIQPHDVWAQSRRTALQVYDTVFSRIFKHLPNVTILPTLGNHEMVPVDSFSPSNLLPIAKDDSPVWLYQKFDAFWSRWLPRETDATITRDGFYAATVRPGLRVISLNTNFCHTRNFWLFINSTDPGNQLQWLVHELQTSELAHEKVHIIGHIPPGADDCMRVWSKNYHRIVKRYVDTITGQFFGHTHTSEFELFYDQGDDVAGSTQRQVPEKRSTDLKPIAAAQIGPSVTTFVDLNPSYRIYTIDPSNDFRPIDYETFFVNLTRANQLGKSVQPEWNSAGMFSKRFDIQDILPSSMHQLLASIARSFAEPTIIVPNSSFEYNIEDQEGENDDDEEEEDDGSDPTDIDDELSNSTNSAIGSMNSTNKVIPAKARALNQVVDDRLYELYRLFNSYSDKFDRAAFEKISLDERKKFVCRLFTGKSHDQTVCKQMIPGLA